MKKAFVWYCRSNRPEKYVIAVALELKDGIAGYDRFSRTRASTGEQSCVSDVAMSETVQIFQLSLVIEPIES